MGKHITTAQSKTIVRVYNESAGKWKRVMAHPDIKATGLERHQVERHIRYKKVCVIKKETTEGVANATASDAPTEPAPHPDQRDEADDRDESTSSFQLALSDEEEDEETEPAEPKRKRSDDPPADARKKQRAEPPSAVSSFGDIGAHLFATSVASLDVQTPDDMARVAQTARAQSKKDAHNSRDNQQRVARARVTQGMADSLQQHQTTVETQASFQSMMQMMTLRMMSRLVRDIDGDEADDEPTDRAKITSLQRDVNALRDEVAALRAQLSAAPPTTGLLFESL